MVGQVKRPPREGSGAGVGPPDLHRHGGIRHHPANDDGRVPSRHTTPAASPSYACTHVAINDVHCSEGAVAQDGTDLGRRQPHALAGGTPRVRQPPQLARGAVHVGVQEGHARQPSDAAAAHIAQGHWHVVPHRGRGGARVSSWPPSWPSWSLCCGRYCANHEDRLLILSCNYVACPGGRGTCTAHRRLRRGRCPPPPPLLSRGTCSATGDHTSTPCGRHKGPGVPRSRGRADRGPRTGAIAAWWRCRRRDTQRPHSQPARRPETSGAGWNGRSWDAGGV
jgi:hypothetical protein